MENQNCCEEVKDEKGCGATYNFYNCCKCGADGEGGNGGINIPVLTESITKTIEITDLQSELDALPKLLMADVTFIVNQGSCSDEIIIERFIGSGILTINGANSAGQTSHNILSMTIRNCANPQITVQGINFTTTAGNAFHMWGCPGTVLYLFYCNSTAGSNSTVGLYGINVADISSAHIQECTISNKYVALRAYRGAKVSVLDLHGTNNREIYSAAKSGTIHKENAGTITGTILNNYAFGGLIVNPSGGVVGS